jgi:hypothetical protein
MPAPAETITVYALAVELDFIDIFMPSDRQR